MKNAFQVLILANLHGTGAAQLGNQFGMYTAAKTIKKLIGLQSRHKSFRVAVEPDYAQPFSVNNVREDGS